MLHETPILYWLVEQQYFFYLIVPKHSKDFKTGIYHYRELITYCISFTFLFFYYDVCGGKEKTLFILIQAFSSLC